MKVATNPHSLPRYCDASLPVPMDQPFTYALPETLRHRVKPGCRILVPFGRRTLTGVVLRTHDESPAMAAKLVLRLLDEEPVLDEGLLALGRWIAHYYCAPLGEVLRSMTPLGGEIRRSKQYSLSDAGRDAVRQLLLGTPGEDASVTVLRALEFRSLTALAVAKKATGGDKALAEKNAQSACEKGVRLE